MTAVHYASARAHLLMQHCKLNFPDVIWTVMEPFEGEGDNADEYEQESMRKGRLWCLSGWQSLTLVGDLDLV